LFHATTADRDASGVGKVITDDHKFGYAIHELCMSKGEERQRVEIAEGTSLYCVQGRGWISLSSGRIRYALEPGTVFAMTIPGSGIFLSADEDLKILRVDRAQ
jgi:hypothetical protein